MTVGFGFLLAFDHPPLDLSTSALIIPLAHALVAIPFVVRVLVPALRSIDPRLREVLDGMRFVIGHELTKVFQREFPRLTDDRSQPGYTRADLSRAWGLLHNCFQQTAITLAQAFDAGARGAQLFEDYKSRVETSLTLQRELNGLLKKRG